MEDFAWDRSSVLKHIKSKGNLEKKDKNGWTPLFYVSLCGHLDILKALIEAGVDVNSTSSEGFKKEFLIACIYQSVDFVKVFLEAGADINDMFLLSENEFLSFAKDPFVKESIENKVCHLTSVNQLKWKAYRMKNLFK